MKFFSCSILILAGAFALIDAIPSIDDQMRLATYDNKLILEDLKLVTANRDAGSIACSQELLASMNELMGRYNTNMSDCEEAEKNQIDALNKNAQENVDEFNSRISAGCASDCSSLSSPADGLNCVQEQTSKNSKISSEISGSASTLYVSLIKAIEDAHGVKSLCTQIAYTDYSSGLLVVQDNFDKCVDKKDQY